MSGCGMITTLQIFQLQENHPMLNKLDSNSPTMAIPDVSAGAYGDAGGERPSGQASCAAFPKDVPLTIERPSPTVRLILVVEGGFDIQFLKRISHVLHADDSRLPELRTLEQSGIIAFLPSGGSNLCHWTHRLSGFGIPEFHVYDRELPPLTAERQHAADLVNRRHDCHAVLTGKRAMENYLDPQTLHEARGIDVKFGDEDDVAELVAQRMLEQSGGPAWAELPSRGRRRLKNRAKKWLNTEAVARMTADRLAQRDPDADIRLWLTTIACLCGLHDGSTCSA
jgi:hypothetical protein